MAATVLTSYCCSSSLKPIDDSSKQLEETKSVKFPERARNSRRHPSRPSIKPNSPAVTRSLLALADSGCAMDSALQLFEKMNHSDTFIWNVIIRGLARNGLFSEAVDFYRRMEREGIRMDYFTFPFVIKACGELMWLTEGQRVHARLIKVGLDSDIYVCNFLVEMYFSVGCAELAEKVFEEMPQRDLVSWNSMVAGYLSAGDGFSSLGWFREMIGSGKKPDRFGVISALGACSKESCLKSGKEIHCLVIKNGIDLDVMVGTSLVDMYGKCGEVRSAEMVFHLIPLKNVAVWNSLINAYVVSGKSAESFACLRLMQEDQHMVPDAISLINVLPSCSQVGSLKECQSIHGYAFRKLLLPQVVLETSLVDAYGKCAAVRSAERLFSVISEKNLISWNTMIAVYVQNEKHEEALELFQEMCLKQYHHLKPDAITIASILPSYAELAMVNECKQIHALAAKFGSNTVISNALIHAYAKCGDLDTARRIFDRMPGKNLVSWNTMILAYGMHGFGETAIATFSQMRETGIEPDQGSFVSLLYSCSISGLIEQGWEYFNAMKSEYNIDPGIEQYGCMIDLLGRSGNLDAAREFIEQMPLPPTARIWGSFLSASRNNNDLASAELAASKISSLEHDNTGCYVLLSNMYAEAGRWEDVNRIKSLMKEKGLAKTTASCSVQIGGKSERFVYHDVSHREANMISEVLDVMLKQTGEDVKMNMKFRPVDLIKRRRGSPEGHAVRLAICLGLVSTAVGKPFVVRQNTRICKDCHRLAKKISRACNREIVVGDGKAFHHFNGGVCSCGDYW
ncbi:unnamed protein product [Linum tenue]|uniref:DYW domain-containing protein n=1 Tax=Linum tenue TaxID=586396 RepID=A0AAV0PE71_9ROSI|nr:unnamed protein product [Linum tenue]